LFLGEFVGDVPWAHLDIAGPARAASDDGYVVKGGTGFGVRTLVALAADFTAPRPRPAKRAPAKKPVAKKAPAKKAAATKRAAKRSPQKSR
jgi:hypothetical protein